ncbi:MAG: HlyD family efflux transporter periplasmic adaptor subunit, partial [Planctomycetota bacterium]
GWSELELTGLLRAPRVSELAYGRGEILHEVRVREGQRVERGEVLLVLDLRRLKAERAEADARLAQARAVLDELERGPREETLAAARAACRQAEAEVGLWTKKLARREDLVRDGVSAPEVGDETAAQLDVARARLDAQKEQLRELETGTRPEQLAAQRALVAQLVQARELVETHWTDAHMVAPFAGVVADVRVEVGEVMLPGQPILRLVEDAPLEAWIGAPPSVALEVGAATAVRVDGREVSATVQALLPELDPQTRTRTVVLRLAPDAGLVPGRVVRWRVPEPTPPAGWNVPLGALVRGERDTWALLVAAPTDAGFVVERRRVEVKGTDGRRAWIVGDVTPADRVIADGTHRAVVGQAVEPQ